MLRPTVSRPVCLGIKHPSRACDQIFISARNTECVWQLRSWFHGAPSLTRGRVCLLYVPLALASAVFFGPSPLGLATVFSLFFQIQGFVEGSTPSEAQEVMAQEEPGILSLSLVLRQTVSRPVCLGIKHPSGAYDQIFFSIRNTEYVWQLRSLFRGTPSLTRGRVCLLYVPLALASAVFLGRSPLELATVFYCLRFETSLFVASYYSQGHGGGIRSRLHTGVCMGSCKRTRVI
jgi:hypothetical protein